MAEKHRILYTKMVSLSHVLLSQIRWLIAIVLCLLNLACQSNFSPSSAALASCDTLTGSAWAPNVSGVSASYRDATVSISKNEQTVTGTLVGTSEAGALAKETTVTIDMSSNLGLWGSLQLEAEVTGVSGGYQGSAIPILTSLVDNSGNEFINAARSGAAGDCVQQGYFTCVGSTCSYNPSCTISSPSAYGTTTSWRLHQEVGGLDGANRMSINLFPTCSWAGGAGTTTSPTCAFTSTFFPSSPQTDRLSFGGNYTAKYILISDSYLTVPSGITATLKVTAVKKTDANAGGAVDVNFIIVGTNNIRASRTTKGQQNLNTLAGTLVDYLGAASPNVKVSSLNNIEFPCESGGDSFATTSEDSLGTLLKRTSSLVPSSLEGRAINVFFVSSITSSTDGSTTLGIDGSIPGSIYSGNPASGMMVATFDALSTMNSSCASGATTCAVGTRDLNFWYLQTAVTHEIGHYLGLQHLSEAAGTAHDPIADTPFCTNKASSGYLSSTSCLADTNTLNGVQCSANCTSYSTSTGTYCPTVLECAFNYMMFWTIRNFYPTTGASDGGLFSSNQGVVINYHPVVQ